jgi:hypothetical protein
LPQCVRNVVEQGLANAGLKAVLLCRLAYALMRGYAGRALKVDFRQCLARK